MKAEEAKALFSTLAANWPTVPIGAMNVELYTAKLQGYDYDVGVVAVAAVIEEEVRWPPWAKIREAASIELARRRREAAELRGLPEPELTPRERKANLARVRALVRGIGDRVPDA